MITYTVANKRAGLKGAEQLFIFVCFFCPTMQFFFYQEESFPPTRGLFKGHAVWSGNVLKNDGSITLTDVQSSFNGTYTCQVRNPPDVHGFTGELRLEVVQSGETRRR